MTRFHIVVTDTFGGEANYCWKRDYYVNAQSFRGAITALARKEGAGWRKDYDCGDRARYNLRNAAICAFVEYADD